MGLANLKASEENLLSRRTNSFLQGLVAFVAALWLALAVVSSGALAQTANTNTVPAFTKTQPAPAKTGLTQTAPATQTSNTDFKVDQNFNHQTTRFPLEGMHVQVTCETCHKGGIFKGVPTACVGCHNDTMAKGKSPTHPSTSNECADCHNSVDWSQVHVDHSKISKGCFTCHDGKTAEGKSKTHIKSSKLCEDCHLVTTWTIAHFNHETTNEPCQVCHDGLHTAGKPFTHIRSTNDCASCHRTISWKVGVFDHTGVVDGCFKCHDGVSATGKSGAHLVTSNDCQLCHNTVAWSPSNFDHNDPVVSSTVTAPLGCVTCHDGRRATGRSSQHLPTASNDCAACHVVTAWKPAKWDHTLALDVANCVTCHDGTHVTTAGAALGKVNAPSPHVPSSNACTDCHTGATGYKTWAGTKMNHANINTGCVQCHTNPARFTDANGAPVQGKQLPPAHIAATDSCESCHTIGVTFKPAILPLDHSQVVGTCVSCHDGQFAGVVARSKAATDAKAPPHNTKAFDSCDACHNTSTFIPAKTFDHTIAGNVSNCVSCHNGTIAQGMLSGALGFHIPVNGGQSPVCSDCHNNFSVWTPAVIDHTKVSGVCLDCHNGVMKISKGLLTTKAKTHITTSLGCENCHTSFTNWKTALFDHTGLDPATKCASCHDGVQATGIVNATVPHIPFPASNDCSACHTTTSWSPVAFDAAKHGLVSATCLDCHNGTQGISKGKLVSKPTPHISTTANCSDCHKSFTTWVTTFVHDAATIGGKTCVSCHNGVTAKGKTNALVTHIPTSDDCAACHDHTTFVAFSPVTFGAAEHALVANSCVTCHNGTTAITTGKLVAKPTPHIPFPATTNCSTCHTSFVTWVTKFDHTTRGATTCFACHDGKLATAKGTNHVPASTTCDNCHSTTQFTTWVPVKLPFNHSDPGAAGQACEKCHDGTLATGRDAVHILTSTAACASCHTSQTVWSALSANFHGFVTGTCFSCHDGGHKTGVVLKTITGKDAPHLATTDLCENCHVANNSTWAPAKVFDHTQTQATCFTCHDGAHKLPSGVVVLGKANSPTPHVPTSNDCAACHTSVTKFATWTFSHADPTVYAAQCVSCHDGQFAGVVARAKAATDLKAPAHTSAFNTCSNCHTTVAFIPAHFDHTAILAAGTPCASCHDTGKTNAVVRPATHIAITGGKDPNGNDCAVCHTTATWVTNAKPDHSSFTAATNCFACHDTKIATGMSTSHYKITGNTCGACHNTTAFVPAVTFDHTLAANVTPCVTCHDGTHTNALGKASYPAHPNTTTVCEACHASYVSWVTTKFDHTQTAPGATCESCHDGAHAPAMAKSTAHLNTSMACANCHNSSNAGFKPAVTFDHGQTTASCVTCHDALHSVSTGPIVGKSNKHLSTTNACVNCHNTTKFTPGLTPRQTDHTQVLGTCFSCHSGTISITTGPVVGKLQGPSGTHLTTVNTCELCHSTTSFIPATAFDHTGVAAGSCFTCHNNAPTIGKPATHMSTNNTCDSCHTTIVWKPVPKTQFQHTATLGACNSCHGGTLTISTGLVTKKSANHIASTTLCANCHLSTANWNVAATQVDHTQVTGICSTCHNGTKTLSLTGGLISHKSAAHIASGTACDACHKSTANWNVTAAQVDHTQVTGACSTCHNGTKTLSLTGGLISHKSATHLNSTTACDACHTTGGVPWTPAKAFDHTQAVGTCYSCHNGTSKTSVKVITPKDAPHLNTTNTCESCHVSGTVSTDWKVAPVTKFDHSQALGTCMACHNGSNKMGVTGTVLDYKLPTHFITTKDCSICHTTTVWNPMLTYTHTSAAYVAHYFATQTSCLTCHKQNNEKITYLQPGLFPNCAACHADKFSPGAHPKYNSPKQTFYTFTELKDCSGACHTYTDQTLTTISKSQPGPHHRPTNSSFSN